MFCKHVPKRTRSFLHTRTYTTRAPTQMSSTTAPNTQIVWANLPADVIALILQFYVTATVDSQPMKNAKNIMFKLLTTNTTFATAAKPIAPLFYPPTMKGHAEQLVKIIIVSVFFAYKHWNTMGKGAGSTMYTCVYNGAVQKPPFNQSRKYYNFLGKTLTDLVRNGAIPWKNVDEIQRELGCLKWIFGYLDRFYAHNFQLPKVQKLIHEAYLAGNPNLEEFKYYDPGPPRPRNTLIEDPFPED